MEQGSFWRRLKEELLTGHYRQMGSTSPRLSAGSRRTLESSRRTPVFRYSPLQMARSELYQCRGGRELGTSTGRRMARVYGHPPFTKRMGGASQASRVLHS